MSDLRESIAKAMEGKQVENVVNEDDSVIEHPSADEVKASEDNGIFGDQEGVEAKGGKERLNDEGSEVKEGLNDDPEAKKDPEEKQEDSGDTPEGKHGDATNDKSKDKPPVGWTPENREQWGKLPQSVRNQISKREQEVNKVLQESANARKFTNEFYQTIDPYKSLMVSEGASSPVHAVQNLLQTAATLKMGNKAQKAHRIAELIKHYDIDIVELDNVLSTGQATPQKQAPQDISQLVEQQVQQRMQPYEQQRQQQVQQRASQALVRVQKAEFFNDVRNDMADLIEVATKHGRRLTPEEAYDRAVRMNSEVQKVLRQRQQQGLNSKKNAASSVNGKRGGVGSDNADQSLRDMIEANWSASMRG